MHDWDIAPISKYLPTLELCIPSITVRLGDTNARASYIGRISDAIAENRRDLEHKCNLLDLGPSKTQILKAPIVRLIIDSHFVCWIVGYMALRCIVLDYSSRSVKKSCDMFCSLVSVEQHHRYVYRLLRQLQRA